MVCGLEALPPGRRFAARDGSRFIRTNFICFGFCDLATGQLCSARDICSKHGGVGARRTQSAGPDHEAIWKQQAAAARHDS
jgi:hypothetical protein